MYTSTVLSVLTVLAPIFVWTMQSSRSKWKILKQSTRTRCLSLGGLAHKTDNLEQSSRILISRALYIKERHQTIECRTRQCTHHRSTLSIVFD